MTSTPQPAASQAQYCYRHPDRRAGVGCQRCGRPICPSCMSTAAVGFQCPECAKPQPGTAKILRPLAERSTPVTYGLIAVNVAMFLVTFLVRGASNPKYTLDLFAGLYTDGTVGGIANGEWWRVITGGFMHAGILHIAFNMFALYSIGTVIERVAGSLRFAAIYFASLAGGALFAILFSSPFASTVGASGAIFGLFGAFVFLQLSRGMNPWSSGIMSTIGLNLAITFLIPGISKGGHVGGLLLGVLLGWVMFGRSRQEAVQRERLATTLSALTFALGLFLCVATVFAAHYVVENGPLLSLT